MCGIAGFIGAVPYPEFLIQEMTNSLHHRGPDSTGYWTSKRNHISLGHTRLAIVDLTPAGAQPMVSKSERYSISFNGEIYNHQSIRKDLQQKGLISAWCGTSDTETILCAFEAWGIERTLNACIGMFAIAIWDNKEKKITLARDRFGEKPLYYQPLSEGIIFSSELSALRLHPKASQEICQHAIQHLATSQCIPAPLSIIKNIYKLLPGSLITFNNNGFVSTKQWWSPIDTTIANSNSWQGDDHEAIEEIHSRLRAAVNRQLMSDVPLGTMLSGGIDSSLITALMSELSETKIKSFSIGFCDSHFDEAIHAKCIANYFHTEHIELYPEKEQILESVYRMQDVFSEPFADSSQVPTYLVSKLAKEHVTVALTGDAGDEIFAGYNRHIFANNHWNTIRKIPRPVRSISAKLINITKEENLDKFFGYLPFTSNWTRIGEKLHKNSNVLVSDTLSQLYDNSVLTHTSSHVLINNLPNDNCIGPQSALLRERDNTMIALSSELEPFRWMMLKDQLSYMTNDILVKVDRCSMASSLETRVPFLDHKLVEFTQKLPSRLFINGAKGKQPLRTLLEKHIPKKYFDRPKMGFSIPLHSLLRTELNEWANDYLTKNAIDNIGAFDSTIVKKLWDDHINEKSNNFHLLWPVLMYQAWSTKQ